MIDKICIIGVGLIGGSFAKGLKQSGKVNTIIGYGRSDFNLSKAVELGVIDNYTTDITTALSDVQMVVVATPVDSFKQVLNSIKSHIDNSVIITDVGSTKGSVINIAKEVFGQIPVNFVPAHPIAGKEKSGVEAADQSLFNNKRVIITPSENTNKASIDMVGNLWQAIGANVEIMNAKSHDDLLGMTSHLPHMLAFALMDYLISKNPDACDYAAGGFKDFSRIASSDSVMWRDICLNNADEIIKHIDGYKDTLDKLSSLIKEHNSQKLEKLFLDAKSARDNWLDN